MALIPCPECKRDVSDKAISCPNCGCPIASKTPMNKMFETNRQQMNDISVRYAQERKRLQDQRVLALIIGIVIAIVGSLIGFEGFAFSLIALLVVLFITFVITIIIDNKDHWLANVFICALGYIIGMVLAIFIT